MDSIEWQQSIDKNKAEQMKLKQKEEKRDKKYIKKYIKKFYKKQINYINYILKNSLETDLFVKYEEYELFYETKPNWDMYMFGWKEWCKRKASWEAWELTKKYFRRNEINVDIGNNDCLHITMWR